MIIFEVSKLLTPTVEQQWTDFFPPTSQPHRHQYQALQTFPAFLSSEDRVSLFPYPATQVPAGPLLFLFLTIVGFRSSDSSGNLI